MNRTSQKIAQFHFCTIYLIVTNHHQVTINLFMKLNIKQHNADLSIQHSILDDMTQCKEKN